MNLFSIKIKHKWNSLLCWLMVDKKPLCKCGGPNEL